MGMTLAEKILARQSGLERVTPGQIVEAKVNGVMLHDIGTPGIQRPFNELGAERIAPNVECVIVPDHYVPAPTVPAAENLKLTREFARRMHVAHYYEIGRGGISHQVMVEKGHVRPWEIIVAPDSHATTYGACGAFGTGLGVTDTAIALAIGHLWFQVPKTTRVSLKGKLQPFVSAKDVSLFLLGQFSESGLVYQSLEPTGPIMEEMSVEGRLTMADMALEMGVKTCLIPTDAKMVNFLERVCKRKIEPITSGPDAEYAKDLEFDLNDLAPLVAAPHSPANVKKASDLSNVKVDQAFLGSCTNGRIEDLRVSAALLAGRKVHPDVRMIVTPASHEIARQAMNEGLFAVMMEAGATITNPSCGVCIGGHLGVIAAGETCIASSNRNFKGRMGSSEGFGYLASPATVAASAIAGCITDPRTLTA